MKIVTSKPWLDRPIEARICEFDDCLSVLSKDQKKFCSQACKGEGSRNRVVIVCLNCGEEKEVLKSIRNRRKFCDKKCQRAYGRIVITCPSCGKKKEVRKSRKAKFCDRKCHGLSMEVAKWPDGNGINWLIDKKGYVYAEWRKHPLAQKGRNRVRKNRHVVWEASGFDPKVLEQLKNGATVHHKNGKRDDNRIENLETRIDSRHPQGINLNDMREILSAFGDKIQKGPLV